MKEKLISSLNYSVGVHVLGSKLKCVSYKAYISKNCRYNVFCVYCNDLFYLEENRIEQCLLLNSRDFFGVIQEWACLVLTKWSWIMRS